MTDSADRWAEVEKAVELAKDSTRFCVDALVERIEALEAKLKSAPT